ncbi:nuclease NurA [Acidianus sulfidivorans JP7]|uniref:Nuclease NurA n=1 Tax=Acidianus sulfidivorans JP7 TaxID=619593 RepID=A0A2U9IJA1_9CREN|nr:DNA double-strand break repair nuclease NurA [Acidianus sulfidivorans]AWR96122.1 nuclease NurA [Acidianus sulfidivorans JP7]
MEIHEAINNLIKTLSRISETKPFLSQLPEIPLEEEGHEVEVVGSLDISKLNSLTSLHEANDENCPPFTSYSYLDSSSRTLNVRGANIHIASLYANVNGTHEMIPANVIQPFIGVKASKDVLLSLESSLPFVRVKNPNGYYYTEEYKDDNILDELRISLENYAINKGNLTIVDGPIYPGPYLPSVGEPYRSAYVKLILERKVDKLVGIVKRLSMTRKLTRLKTDLSKIKIDLPRINASDDVVMQYWGKDKEVFISPVLKELFFLDGNKTLTRYMVYVKVRDSVFRVESADLNLLCRGVSTALKDVSVRGIPTFIEIADKMSRKLSASALLLTFSLAKQFLGVNYDDWNRVNQANLELME